MLKTFHRSEITALRRKLRRLPAIIQLALILMTVHNQRINQLTN